MFIGYSFSDINIRIIWFRLLDMMKGVEQADMPTSYMVIVKPNRVEELLYKDAGIETIILDPSNETEPDRYPVLVGDFLYDLASQVCAPDIPGSSENPFVSQTLLRRAAASNVRDGNFGRNRRVNRDMQRLSTYRIPGQYLEDTFDLFSSETNITRDSIEAALALYERRQEDERIKLFLLRSAITAWGMTLQDDTRIDWDSMGNMRVEPELRGKIFSKVGRELEYHESSFDAELFFAAYFVIDMHEGRFGATPDDRESAESFFVVWKIDTLVQ